MQPSTAAGAAAAAEVSREQLRHGAGWGQTSPVVCMLLCSYVCCCRHHSTDAIAWFIIYGLASMN
jgi:hypothetical protein